MKKFYLLVIMSLLIMILPTPARAAGGIYASGGGAQVAGKNFTVSVTASGASFNALEGVISVSGASVVSFSPGSAVWMTSPANGVHFVGMLTSPTSSLRVATITLKGTSVGSGKVSVSGVRLALTGNSVGTGAGGVNFTIARAPTPPGAVVVTSSSHSDPTQQYEATAIVLSWTKPANGATGYSYLLDQSADTTPAQSVTSGGATVTYNDQAIGIHYFHIRAVNADGWGPATHFKITIKEPENSIAKELGGPKNITISKSANFKNDIKNGTVTGLVIKGSIPTQATMEKFVPKLDSAQAQDPTILAKAEIYQANIKLTPLITIPEGKSLSVKPDKYGNFKLLIDYPIPAGFYKLTIQGQRAKILTKASSEIRFQIGQQNGGNIILLSDRDAREIVPPKPNFWQKYKVEIESGGAVLLAEIILLAVFMLISLAKNGRKSEIKQDKNKKQNFDWDKV